MPLRKSTCGVGVEPVSTAEKQLGVPCLFLFHGNSSPTIADKRGGKNTLETLDLLEEIDDDLDRLGITMVKVYTER
jgi:hypothetical protein